MGKIWRKNSNFSINLKILWNFCAHIVLYLLHCGITVTLLQNSTRTFFYWFCAKVRFMTLLAIHSLISPVDWRVDIGVRSISLADRIAAQATCNIRWSCSFMKRTVSSESFVRLRRYIMSEFAGFVARPQTPFSSSPLHKYSKRMQLKWGLLCLLQIDSMHLTPDSLHWLDTMHFCTSMVAADSQLPLLLRGFVSYLIRCHRYLDSNWSVYF